MTTQLAIPATNTQHQYVQLGGGLDLLTPVLQLKPGYVKDALNFEQSINGGYTRIAGYERFDGKAAPSAALYFTLTATPIGTIVAGATITGSTSGATGRVLSVVALDAGQAAIAYTLATGTFVAGEDLTVGGPVLATNISAGGGGTAPDYDVSQQALAANVYRQLILAVPGSGPVRGGFFYNGLVYAFRNNAGGTALNLWKSSAGGWVAVTTPALLPDGRVQTDLGNFTGVVHVFGCDGVNKGWRFDGTTLTLITTGNVPDVPTNVLAHQSHLFFSFGTNLQNSGIADPMTWTAPSGSASYRFDDVITSLQRQPGNQGGGAMSVSTESSTSMLYGSSAADFQVVPFEQSAGARLYGGQRLGGQTVVFGNIGVFTLSASQAFGNFEPTSLTMKIRPFTQTRRNQATASLVNREKSQYRVFFNDGYGLYMTLLNGRLMGSMPVFFPHPVKSAWQGESDDGSEASYFGDSLGFVYRLDSGTSHDGQNIAAFLTLTFANQGAARIIKRYRRASFEIQGDSYAEFSLTYELNYGAGDRPQGDSPVAGSVLLSAVRWDEFTWDNFTWDGKSLAPNTLELLGTGENIALRIDSSSDKFQSFTLNSIIIDHVPRRGLRT